MRSALTDISTSNPIHSCCLGLGPWEPVSRDGKLFGRGGADDGYAVFSSLTAIAASQGQAIPLAAVC